MDINIFDQLEEKIGILLEQFERLRAEQSELNRKIALKDQEIEVLQNKIAKFSELKQQINAKVEKAIRNINEMIRK